MRKQISWLTSFFLSFACSWTLADQFTYSLTGNAVDTRPECVEGALMLMGGGGRIDEAYRWFIQKAGGGDIVVLKASESGLSEFDNYGTFMHSTLGGCDSVEVICFHSRLAASDSRVLQSIRSAEGILIAGGKQFLYADYWKDTPVAEALDGHVRAGRPLGGSSAGLAVLGQFCYTAHVTAKLTSELAMIDPFGRSLTLENDFLHLDLMRGVVTDSHFSARGRLGRLITFMARMQAENEVEQLVGIGVDERTALCLDAEGRGRVFTTAAQGFAWFVTIPSQAEVLVKGEPLTCRHIKIVAAGVDSQVNVRSRTVNKPASEAIVSVVSGKLTYHDR